MGCNIVHGNMELTLCSVTTLADYTIRSMKLHKVSTAPALWCSKYHVGGWLGGWPNKLWQCINQECVSLQLDEVIQDVMIMTND